MKLNCSLVRLHAAQPRRCSNNSACSSTDNWPIAANAASSSKSSCFRITNLLACNPHIASLVGFGQLVAQFIQTTVVVMPDVTERFPCLLGDFFHRESLKISQVQHTLLNRTEGLKTPLNDLSRLVASRNA